MDWVRAHERELTAYAYDRLSEVEGLRILGPGPEQRGGLIAFTLEGVHPHDIAAILDREGVAVRAGHHCAQPLHDRYGIPASARASFYLYNTVQEVDVLAEALHKAQELFALSKEEALMSTDALYREAILDHYKHPRQKGHLDSIRISTITTTTPSAATRSRLT